jgi:tRNA threonylcarbamoyl adenosine modification protein YeaZ
MNEKSSMKLLALDFSTLRRSAAVLDETGNLISSVTQQPQRAGSPFPLISETLGTIAPEQIDAIAVGLGPGSYTGIRSSLAIAQGWNLARNIPAAGISSVDAVVFAAVEKGLRGEVEVVIDAQRNELYSAIYQLTSETFSLLRPLKILAQPETTRLIGPEANRWSKEAVIIEPSAAAIGKLAAREKKFGPPEALEAIYLREPSFVKAPAVRHA